MGHGGGHIGSHDVRQLFGFAVNWDTLVMTWLTMAIVIILVFIGTRGLRMVPGKWQAAIEMTIESLIGMVDNNMGPRGLKLAPLIVSLFLFLLVGNMLGLIPSLTSPTNDLNTTLALALLVVGIMHVLGLKNKGLQYLKHFLGPEFQIGTGFVAVFVTVLKSAFFLPLSIIEELARPITLSFRLFGNILAGEVLLIILGQLVPYLIPTVWLAFSVFVGVIQAFIFTTLATVYLSNAVSDHH